MKSSRPIGDDPDLRLALNLAYNFVRYCIYIYIKILSQLGPDDSLSRWVTLLNLSGEAPLCEYTTVGKFISALMGTVVALVEFHFWGFP